MARLTMTPIGSQSSDITIVKTGTNRKWKWICMILAVLCVGLILMNILVALKMFRSCDSIETWMKTSTETNTNDNRTSTVADSNEEHWIAEGGDIKDPTAKPDSVHNIIFNSSRPNLANHYSPCAPSNFTGFEKFVGLPLNHFVYYNFNHYTEIQGFMVNMTFRLFRSWEGKNPLFIYAISSYYLSHRITFRHPVMPESNTTDWQTVDIPVGVFPVFVRNHFAIGMETADEVNEIFAVRSTMSIRGVNITNQTHSIDPYVQPEYYGVAFTYTVIKNGQSELLTAPLDR